MRHTLSTIAHEKADKLTHGVAVHQNDSVS